MDQILKGHVSRVKKFRFYLKGSEDPVADLSRTKYGQNGKVRLDAIKKQGRGKSLWSSTQEG